MTHIGVLLSTLQRNELLLAEALTLVAGRESGALARRSRRLADIAYRDACALAPVIERFGRSSTLAADRLRDALFRDEHDGDRLIADLHDSAVLAHEVCLAWSIVDTLATSRFDEALIELVARCRPAAVRARRWIERQLRLAMVGAPPQRPRVQVDMVARPAPPPLSPLESALAAASSRLG
jgi:hypothetical protein